MAKKICFLTSGYDVPRQRMLEYYEKIIPKDVEIHLFCNKEDVDKFEIKRIKKYGYTSPRALLFLELRRYCKKEGIDILTNLARRTKIAFLMGVATRFTKTKVVFYDHGNPGKGAMFLISLFQTMLDRVLIGTPDLADKYKRYLKLIKNRVHPLPTAIDVNYWKEGNKQKARKKLGLKKEDKAIGFVGRVQYMKGSDVMLEVIKDNPDKKFIVIGNMMDENYDLKKLKNIKHIPFADKKELREIHPGLDLFFFPSRSEGLGLAYREAMSCGIPAIISDIEALRTVNSAIKVEVNAQKMKEKVKWFFELSQKERDKIGKDSRKTMVEEHSEEALEETHLRNFLLLD